MTVDEMTRNMEENGFNENFPLTIVKMDDGEFTSVDNRRLFSVRNVDLNKNASLKFVPCIIKDKDDPLPPD